MPDAQMTPGELMDFVGRVFPQALSFGFDVELAEYGRVVVSLDTEHQHLRPGGTVSGPTMMTLADTAMWFVTLVAIGPVPSAVTSNLNIHFLQRPPPGKLLAEGKLLRLGSRLAVGEVAMRGEGEEALFAHATVTYSIPPPHKRTLA